MAVVDLALSVDFRPAFHTLIASAEAIAETHGEEAAIQWAGKVLLADFSLFCHVTLQQPRPALTLIQGGRS